MKRILVVILFLLPLFALAQRAGEMPPRPNPPKLVNDLTGTLTPAQVQALEAKLVAYDDSTSSQIAVVIVNSTGDNDIAEYGLKLGREWGVGGKEFRNGVILLIAMEDHRSRIEVGYGLEGAIPDITAKAILDNSLTPQFKQGNYYRGIEMATNDIIAAAAGEYKAPAGYGSKKGSKGIGLGSIIFLVVLFLLIGGLGGGAGGRGGRGGMMSATGWIIGSMLGSASSRGGGWSGGGGGGGGGFGGFGGGSFGGGGASGSW